jgi:very-short-patch-repair endonuclease
VAWSTRTDKSLARDLRTNATDAERKLWQQIRNRQLIGARFNRQVRIGPYICDFAARTPRLIIELDGGQHMEMPDRERTLYLEAKGYHVVRFWNHEVIENLEGVVQAIETKLKALPQPLPQAGGEPDGTD